MLLGKVIKWGASTLRVAVAKLLLGRKLTLPSEGRPVYLGRGVRLFVAADGHLVFGQGVYLDDRTRLQVNDGASMNIGEYVYMNTNCRVVANDSISIGARTMLGPNVCIFDHDHVFDAEGVHGDLKSGPITIGERCWLGANAIVTRGITIADAVCAGGGRLSPGRSRDRVYTLAPQRSWFADPRVWVMA